MTISKMMHIFRERLVECKAWFPPLYHRKYGYTGSIYSRTALIMFAPKHIIESQLKYGLLLKFLKNISNLRYNPRTHKYEVKERKIQR